MLATYGTNLGPLNPDLVASIEERKAEVAEREGVPGADVPPDAVTSSGSGLDPHISPAYAEIQVARVAAAQDLSEETVRALVEEHTDGRTLGVLGEPHVDVLGLNIAWDDRAMVDEPRRGRLTVYLGAAPGVGKTYAMLGEAR
eukprot:gene6691-8028_t